MPGVSSLLHLSVHFVAVFFGLDESIVHPFLVPVLLFLHLLFVGPKVHLLLSLFFEHLLLLVLDLLDSIFTRLLSLFIHLDLLGHVILHLFEPVL